MYALTIRQPWMWLILAGQKRVENRTWPPPAALIGQPFALHAAARFDRNALAELPSHGVALPEEYDVKAIVGVATVRRVVHEDDGSELTETEMMWFAGPYGWVLRNVVAIEPLDCQGRVGLWKLSAAQDRYVRAELARKAR